MAVSMRSVRIGLVAAALLLLAVLAGYIGYANRKARALAFLQALPRKLGVDITQETDGFTFSKTIKDKKIFTIHAAKEIQHKNGVVTLRDVGIILYGATGARNDRIHGQEFEYDQNNGILRAVGEALIELGPPGDKTTDEAHMIHVKTSGLVFRKDDGTAQTDQGIEFTANGMVGQAVGAAYNSKTNVLVLQSAVKLTGLRGAPGHERPVVLTATRAELDRTGNTVLLEGPRYVSTGEGGAQSVTAAQAVVHTGTDGKPTDVEARGHVQLTGEGHGSVVAERLDLKLLPDGQPREAHLYGGVQFASNTPARQEQGRAQDAHVSFEDGGKARHALLTGAVRLDELASAGSRHLEADHLDLALGGGGKEKVVVRGAVANGSQGALLRLADTTAKGTSATNVRADTLTGRFGPLGLTGLEGTGKTRLERVETSPRGQQTANEISTGDTLSIDTKPSMKGKGRRELARAVQRGSVEIMREALSKKAGAPPEIEHARAAAGDYDATRDELTLTGGAEVTDAASSVFADQVQLVRATGDALAQGGVRVSYAQGKPGSEPMHVLADRAIAHKATGTTEFTAAPGARVRLWQGGSQVEAPVVDFDRTRKVVMAHGSGEPNAVRTILVAESAKPGAKQKPPVRVLSERMMYTDALRQVDFGGQVQVTQLSGTLHAQDAIVFLSPAALKGEAAAASPTDASGSLFKGKVEVVLATGAVELDEPGRKATGSKIVYTAAEDTYVLTGTKAVPPRLTDETQGTITGSLLRFKRGDEAVEVVGGDGGRVRSEPRARQ